VKGKKERKKGTSFNPLSNTRKEGRGEGSFVGFRIDSVERGGEEKKGGGKGEGRYRIPFFCAIERDRPQREMKTACSCRKSDNGERGKGRGGDLLLRCWD